MLKLKVHLNRIPILRFVGSSQLQSDIEIKGPSRRACCHPSDGNLRKSQTFFHQVSSVRISSTPARFVAFLIRGAERTLPRLKSTYLRQNATSYFIINVSDTFSYCFPFVPARRMTPEDSNDLATRRIVVRTTNDRDRGSHIVASGWVSLHRSSSGRKVLPLRETMVTSRCHAART